MVTKTQKAKPVPAASSEDFSPLRERLTQQRQEILNLYHRDVRAGQDAADEPTEDIVDRANNSYNRELMFSLSDTERQTLLQIEDALRRMDVGAYGRCGNCGQLINVLRLQAVPWTRFCIDCQELVEKGLLEADLP